jgi:DNA-binding transcriptional MerR regulator
MAEDFILETRQEKRFAPSVNAAVEAETDDQLLREMAQIPDKLAFKIGEVADLLGVKTYVLRYWETEFEAIRPEKSKNNQRVYTRKDVEVLMMIKKLLYRERFSIEGARAALKRLRKDTKKTKVIMGAAVQLEELRDRAQDLLLDLQRLKEIFR